MPVVGRLDQYSSMLVGEFDEYSMSENLLTYSEQFNNAAWTKSNSSVSSNQITAPDGTLTADKIVENTANSLHFISQNLGTISGNYAVSCFVKAAERFRGYIQIFGSGGNATVQFNLNTGTITGGSGTTTITSYPNGWYKVSASTNFTSAAAVCYFVLLDDSGAGTYTGNGTSGIYLWGTQVEQGSSATDYTQTTTTTKTRVLPSTTNTNITGFSTYFSSGFSENVGVSTVLSANIFPPYDIVNDDFGGTLFGAGQGRYMRQNTDKSVIVYNEIDEVSDFYSRGVIRAGLVLDLDAGIPSSYSGTGTTWTDLSPYGNNGTLTNGPTYNSANGGSIVLDGIDDYINFSSFVNPYSETVIVWARSATELWDETGWISSSRAQNGHIIHPNAGTKSITFYVVPETVSYPSILSITPDNIMIPHMYCYTTNGSNLHQVYFDGSFMGQSTTNITRTLTPSPQRYDVGFDNAGARYGNGNIYSVMRYNRALTAAEITQNYNGLKHRFGL